MVRKLSLFDNKVARRILVSFILAALIPIGVLGLLSYQQVGEQLRAQTVKSLHKSCKSYGMGLIERLNLAESSLRLVAITIKKSGKGGNQITLDHQQSLLGQFDNVAVITIDGEKKSLLGKAEFFPNLTQQEAQEIGSSKTLIRPIIEEGTRNERLWMVVNLVENHPENGLLVGSLKPELIWDVENIEPNQLWVIDESARLMFASDPSFKFPSEVIVKFPQTNSGHFSWLHADTIYVGNFRTVPVKDHFSASDLTIILAQPETLAFAAIQQFSAFIRQLSCLLFLS